MKTCPRGIRAIGFDLGETLLTYRDTPLSWVSLYRAALTSVAIACRYAPAEEQFLAAETILAEHNTRLNPRTEEISADEIFRLILAEWELSADSLATAIEAYFRFFQQRLGGRMGGVARAKERRGRAQILRAAKHVLVQRKS